MATFKIGAFGAIAGGVVGAAVALGPSIGNAQEDATQFSHDDLFIAGSTEATTNAIFPYLQRAQEMLRATHVNGRARAFAVQARGGDPRNPTITGIGNPTIQGIPAGDSLEGKLSVWGSGAYSDSDDSFTTTRYDSETWSVSLGGDYALRDDLIVGLFGTWSDTDSDSSFNNGGSDSDGWSVGPYATYVLNEYLSVDLSFGYSLQDIDNHRRAGGTTITGSQDSRSWFVSTNVNGTYWIDNWGLGGRIGLIHSDADNDGYTDSAGAAINGTESEFTQMQFSGDVSYYIADVLGEGWGLVPRVSLAYNNDVTFQEVKAAGTAVAPDNDRDEFLVGVGASLFGNGPLSFGFDVTKSFEREDFDSYSVSGNVGFRF